LAEIIEGGGGDQSFAHEPNLGLDRTSTKGQGRGWDTGRQTWLVRGGGGPQFAELFRYRQLGGPHGTGRASKQGISEPAARFGKNCCGGSKEAGGELGAPDLCRLGRIAIRGKSLARVKRNALPAGQGGNSQNIQGRDSLTGAKGGGTRVPKRAAAAIEGSWFGWGRRGGFTRRYLAEAGWSTTSAKKPRGTQLRILPARPGTRTLGAGLGKTPGGQAKGPLQRILPALMERGPHVATMFFPNALGIQSAEGGARV